jgi:hypothetical protein
MTAADAAATRSDPKRLLLCFGKAQRSLANNLQFLVSVAATVPINQPLGIHSSIIASTNPAGSAQNSRITR